MSSPAPSKLHIFLREHRLAAFALLGSLLIIILLIVVIFTTTNDDDGIEGTDSKIADASTTADQKALKNYKIANYLPIISEDPAYTISYQLDADDAGNYSFKLVLNAFSASARNAMIKRLLESNFGAEDPLAYDLIIENYYNPFSSLPIEAVAQGSLPTNIVKSSLYRFGDSEYTVQTYTHTLYDGSTNTYRAVIKNGELQTLPRLIFTYADLPYLDQSMVKSLNSLE